MNPTFLDEMSWEIAEVYGAITDQILINLVRHFPFFVADIVPRSAFAYQSTMLAQMGQVNRETIQIIKRNLEGVDPALQGMLEQAIISSIQTTQPELFKAVSEGFLKPGNIPAVVVPNQMRAFNLYYQQSADHLNLVNTVMLESTKSAYQQTVSDVISGLSLSERLNASQLALDIGAGETITGVSSWNTALRHATNRLKTDGITGFIDHAGRHWSAESYVAMDIRTTVFNTARSAVWETNQSFGNDLYIVSYHNGARPLCYPWQNKVISSTDNARTVPDLYGNMIEVHAQSETSYGQAAGLFGINCKHYPNPFIPGVSVIEGKPQDKEENDRVYAESQEQRRLERKLREEKRDVMMAKAQGADDEEIKALREKAHGTSEEIDEFCKRTGRQRRRNREGVYTKREFPSADKYDVSAFERKQQEAINTYFGNGGAQQGYSFEQATQKRTVGDSIPAVSATNAPTQTTSNNLLERYYQGETINIDELPSTIGSQNIFGEEIKFSEKMDSEKWNETKELIKNLSSEFKTKLREVRPGAERAAGITSQTGFEIGISQRRADVVIHEFAHSITIDKQTKYGWYDESAFWNEIKMVRTQYRKAIRNDWRMQISSYADEDKKIGEFMAEAFTLGYMREKNIPIPSTYGEDTIYSSLVLEIVRKYFGK